MRQIIVQEDPLEKYYTFTNSSISCSLHYFS